MRDWLRGRERQYRAGEVVALVDSRGHFLASAFAEADERVAFRVFSRQERERIDAELLAGVLSRALALRHRVLSPGADGAFRLFNAEGDGLPGLAVDVYGPYALVQVYSAGLAGSLKDLVAVLRELLHPAGIFQTDRWSGPGASRMSESRARRIWGESPPDDFAVQEADARFEVDLGGGYNTGLFLDNRENRLALRRYVNGRQVLNLFSYTGSISIHAVKGGAARVTSVDQSDRVLSWSRKNFEANGVSTEDHPLVHADAIEYLRKGAHRGSQHDVIVLDPPSFSTSKKNVFSTERDYRELVSLALEVLAPGGVLMACSNHQKTSPERFLADLAAVGQRQKRPLRLLDFRGAGPDFPVDLAYPEGRILKCAFLSS